jgi:hypothetical protein
MTLSAAPGLDVLENDPGCDYSVSELNTTTAISKFGVVRASCLGRLYRRRTCANTRLGQRIHYECGKLISETMHASLPEVARLHQKREASPQVSTLAAGLATCTI